MSAAGGMALGENKPVMLGALASLDYIVLGGYLLAMVAVGFYFSRQQRTTCDFFLAGRSMGWFPIGLSIMATLVSALSYTGIPGEAYYVGYKFMVMPLATWLTLPILMLVVLPLYLRLEICSIYEYLELRFDAATRLASSLVFVAWRLFWMGGVLYAPCKVLVVAAGLPIRTPWLLLILGAICTLYTFLGGMKAVIWTDVIQAFVMLLGLMLVIGSVWYQGGDGPWRVAEVTRDLGRTAVIDPAFDFADKWSIWGALPHFLLAFLSFYIADQITVQRYLTAKNLATAKRSLVLNCLSVTLMIPLLTYTGAALLAFYHDHPEALRPIWVANVDHRTRESITDAQGRPLIEWGPEAITAENVGELVRDRRLLRPNSDRPFVDAEGLVSEQPAGRRVNVERLVMRQPRSGRVGQGEVLLHQRAKDELMAHFITSQLSYGLAGLIFAAILAASMSSMDSGLNSVCTLLITDFHRRLGIGRRSLARYVGKSVTDLSEADEIRIGRPLVLIVGLVATLFALFIAHIDDIFTIMIAVVNTFGGPLLAVFLLGMFTRRATAAAALWTLAGGTVFTLWLMLANNYASLAWLKFWPTRLSDVWPLTLGVAFSMAFGYGLSFFCGQRKNDEELRGLVFGLGRLGVREPAEASIAIPDSFGIEDDDIGERDSGQN